MTIILNIYSAQSVASVMPEIEDYFLRYYNHCYPEMTEETKYVVI